MRMDLKDARRKTEEMYETLRQQQSFTENAIEQIEAEKKRLYEMYTRLRSGKLGDGNNGNENGAT